MSWPFQFYTVWFGVPLVLLLLFGFLRPRLTPLILLICPIVDMLAYWQDFLYYESRPFILLFIAIQAILIAIPAFLIRAKAVKKEMKYDP